MKAARSIRGTRRRGATPDWGPLEELLGDELCGHFMWMFGVDLEDGTRLNAYKHRWTRCYFHLAGDGRAFYYVSGGIDDGHYRELGPRVAIRAVFRDWECCRPTASERMALRAALAKARAGLG
jgi:hypothetical protein